MEFQVGDKVMLKVSPWKGVVRFGKRGKLNPRYVGPFKVVARVGSVAYKLDLPEELSRVYNTFHVSNMKKSYANEPLDVPLDGLHFDDKLQFVEEPIEIMDREVKRLRNNHVPIFKEEVAKTMAETMEQYMSKTRADYRSGVNRPNTENKVNFELKGQFLKEPRTNTFSGLDHEDANEHIEKVLEIVDLFHIPNITIDQDGLKTKFLKKYCPPAQTSKKMDEINNFQQEPDENIYQAWELFKELLIKCPQYYLTEIHELILFYNGLGIPTRQILDSRGAIPSKTDADAKIAIQEMAEYSQKCHNGTSKSRSTETSNG
nr:putative reverse transcriptase domain-containing protein [Tanacetum cinerariifolium]